MGPIPIELLEAKVKRGEPLTLDDRVYWYEAKAMGHAYSKTEPFIQTATDALAFLARHGIQRTEIELREWLDKQNVPT